MCYNIENDIFAICEILGYSLSELSKKLNIQRSTINRWINGENQISSQKLEMIYNFAYDKGIKLNYLKEQLFKENCKTNEIILFHGAKEKIIGQIDISKSKENNDFGRGFYTGESIFQSASFVANSNNSSVYIFKYKLDPNMKIIEFSVNQEWMLAISIYRGRMNDYKDNKFLMDIVKKVEEADIIIAPIADNQMYKIIDDFIFGNITDVQTQHALSATNLGKQYIFKTAKSLETLEMLERCYLPSTEKHELLFRKKEESEIGLQKVKYVKRQYAGVGKYIEDIIE